MSLKESTSANCDARRRLDAGVGLIEALIAIAMLFTVMAGWLTFAENGLSARKVLAARSEVEDLRQFVRNNLSCELTMEAAAAFCNLPGPREIPVFATEMRRLFGPLDSKVSDKFHMRGLCGKNIGVDKLRIEFHAEGSSEWRSLFPDVDFECPAGRVDDFACDGSEEIINQVAMLNFPKGGTMRSFTNSFPGMTKIPDDSTGNSGQHFAGILEARAICCLAGYGRAVINQVKQYSSCDDNTMGFWKPGQKDWFVTNACNGNSYIGNLTCFGALENGRKRRAHAASFVN